MSDLYGVLGVTRAASDDEIKRAYRQLARELHPDVNPGDAAAEERFKEITRAYDVLSDPERRRQYDVFGEQGPRGPDPFGGGGINDLFDAFFGGNSPFAGGGGGGGRGRGAARGPDLEATLLVDFVDAVFGVTRDVEVATLVGCATCDSSGAAEGTAAATCAECNGTGEVRRVRQSILGQLVTASPCPRCGGAGQEIASPCPDCRGEGRRRQEKTYQVEVPAGVDDGSTLRLTGFGAAGQRGAPSGDLYVHLRVRPHDRFTRQGADLVHVMALPFTQASLGAHLKFETLDGEEDFVIPGGTQTGRVFRLRGRGVPDVHGRGRGDLLVQVQVEVPTALTKTEEELLRRLAEERGEEVAPADTGFFAKIRSAFK
ncbi:MAG TPA: molecular chaperone DnaJ [Acidimicrobiales bacterium]|nr:molecular chaperone DnaJ [Acidimicrobiales bacterium]